MCQLSSAFKKEYGPINIQFPTNLEVENIVEIRIIPKYNAHYFEIEYVYKVHVETTDLDENEALSIDLGIDNLAACLDTLGNAFIIDGKRIKSVNQWYNKENHRLQSIKDKQHIVQSNKRSNPFITETQPYFTRLFKQNHTLHDSALPGTWNR